jgi:ketopantoate reductase
MLQDLEAGKPLEIARKAGVSAPYTESLFGLVRARAQSTGQYR